MERHRQELINVCRIGGKRLTSVSRANQYPAREFATELKTCFEVDVEKDEDGVHPPSICVVCRRKSIHSYIYFSACVKFGGNPCRDVETA